MLDVKVFDVSLEIMRDGKLMLTVMLPRHLAKKLSEFEGSGRKEELIAMGGIIFNRALKSNSGAYWYPPETNPDIPRAERKELTLSQLSEDNDGGRASFNFQSEQTERKQKAERKEYVLLILILVWILPLFGMLLMQGNDGPPATGGISMFGIWFLGFPIAVLIIRKLSR